MTTPKHPLAEVFGHLTSDTSEKADRYRSKRLCPFNNKVPNCTKDKAKDPLGVCSVYYDGRPEITCPIRFRQDWAIADDAASFFFDIHSRWTSLTEVRLNDANGKSAGNIDVVLVSYDDSGRVLDFGALEVQAVYISGNVRDPFEHFMQNPGTRAEMDWSQEVNYPRPDFLSSSRKRLAPQLLFKGGILNTWRKRSAVALSKGFFETLPKLKRAKREAADIAWLIYELSPEIDKGRIIRYQLEKVDEVFTEFAPALASITTPIPGKVGDFMKRLQEKLDEKLENPPTNKTIETPF